MMTDIFKPLKQGSSSKSSLKTCKRTQIPRLVKESGECNLIPSTFKTLKYLKELKKKNTFTELFSKNTNN